MNREPIALYLFRFVLGFGLFAFMAMLYWSSLLIEEKVLDLQTELRDVKEGISTLREDLAHNTRGPAAHEVSSPKSESPSVSNSGFPNLLKEDPFYAKTLPGLLGANFKPHGTFHGATVGRPDNLHPFSNWAEVSSWIGMCTPSLARQEFGKYETLSPDLALKIEERPSSVPGVPEFWVHLREGVFWEPLRKEFFSEEVHLSDHFLKRHPVTAHDFKFYFDALMNPYNQTMGAVAQRNFLSDIQAIEVVDPLTFIVR
jgi:peptide/nickel transport system substrate-binding protein